MQTIVRSPLGVFGTFVLIGLAGVELSNTARLFCQPSDVRTFPAGIVSQGAWSNWAFIRPPKTHSTDISPALIAAHRTWTGQTNLYGELNLGDGPAGFIYPPTAAILLTPFGWLFEQFGESVATQVIDLFWRICALTTVWLASGLAGARHRRELLLIALLFLAFYPLRWMLMCVQAQSLITVLLAWSIVAYARSRGVLSGTLIGLATALKPHFGILLLFGIIRREWRFTCAAITSISVLIVISLFVVGFAPWSDFVTKVLPPVSAGYGFFPNQSVNGIVHRWIGGTTDFKLAPSSPITRTATIIATVVFGALTVWPRTRKRSNLDPVKVNNGNACGISRAMDLGIAVLAATLASPIAWEHFYAWSIILFAACLYVCTDHEDGTRWAKWLAVSYVLLGAFWLPVESATSGVMTLINAPQFFGAVMLLLIAWRLVSGIGDQCRHAICNSSANIDPSRGLQS